MSDSLRHSTVPFSHRTLRTKYLLAQLEHNSCQRRNYSYPFLKLLYLGPWSLQTVQSIHKDKSRADDTKKNWPSPSPQCSEQALQTNIRSWELGDIFTSCSVWSPRTERKHSKVGQVVKIHSYRTIIYSPISQDETVEPWALTAACGQGCIFFFLEGCFSMNQNHNSPPSWKLLGRARPQVNLTSFSWKNLSISWSPTQF